MNKVALSLRKVLHYTDCPIQKPKFKYYLLSVLNLKLTDTDPPFLEMILMSSSSSLPLVSYSRILTLWYCGPVVTGGTTSSLQVGKFSRFRPSSRGCWGSACNTQKQRNQRDPMSLSWYCPMDTGNSCTKHTQCLYYPVKGIIFEKIKFSTLT